MLTTCSINRTSTQGPDRRGRSVAQQNCIDSQNPSQHQLRLNSNQAELQFNLQVLPNPRLQCIYPYRRHNRRRLFPPIFRLTDPDHRWELDSSSSRPGRTPVLGRWLSRPPCRNVEEDERGDGRNMKPSIVTTCAANHHVYSSIFLSLD